MRKLYAHTQIRFGVCPYCRKGLRRRAHKKFCPVCSLKRVDLPDEESGRVISDIHDQSVYSVLYITGER